MKPEVFFLLAGLLTRWINESFKTCHPAAIGWHALIWKITIDKKRENKLKV